MKTMKSSFLQDTIVGSNAFRTQVKRKSVNGTWVAVTSRWVIQTKQVLTIDKIFAERREKTWNE